MVLRSGTKFSPWFCAIPFFKLFLGQVKDQNVITRVESQVLHSHVEFLRVLGSQSGVSVWQHTLVG